MIALVDYGVGNLFSLTCSLKACGIDACVSADAAQLREAQGIILPGVGAFGDAIDKLHQTGLDEELRKLASEGKPLLGICLGMQLLFDESEEFGAHAGLGLIPGRVVPLQGRIDEGLLIPHMGWNGLTYTGNPSKLLADTKEGSYVYFVHSYFATECDAHTTATADYSIPVTAVVERDNVMGTQFHPEKSGDVGLRILKTFYELCKG